MKTVELPIEEIEELQNHFSQASLVGRSDHEDPETYRKFKYAAGRNYEACRAIVKKANKEKEKILQPSPEYNEYRNKANVIMSEHAKRDAKGDIDYKQDGDQMLYQFDADAEKIVHEKMNALDELYAETLRAVENQIARAKSYFADNTAELKIFMFPWNQVPEKLSGGYTAAISVMLEEIPAEFSQSQENEVDKK